MNLHSERPWAEVHYYTIKSWADLVWRTWGVKIRGHNVNNQCVAVFLACCLRWYARRPIVFVTNEQNLNIPIIYLTSHI